MANLNNKTILDVKVGNIIKKYSTDKVILLGEYYQKGSEYIENIEVVINPGEGGAEIKSEIPYRGYNLELFLGDFNGDEIDEIMVRGAYGGTGGFAIASIYNYKDGKLNEVFNPNMFFDKYDFKARYLENTMVEVYSESINEKFNFYIGNKPKVYLDIIYDENGRVKENNLPTVSAINNAFPIKTVYNKFYYLLIRQRVVGVSNADTIGFIESLITLLDNKINIATIGSFEFGENIKNINEEREEENRNFNFRGNSKELNDMKNKNLIEENSKDFRIKKTSKTGDSLFIDFYKNNKEDYEHDLIEIGFNEGRSLKEEMLNEVEIPREIANKLPKEVNFVKEENSNKAIIRKVDLGKNCKGVLVPYTLGENSYISFMEKGEFGYSLKSSFRENLKYLNDLMIKKIDLNIYVFAGFKVEEDINKLYILTLRGGKLCKAFENNEYFYSKMYLEDINNGSNFELILWIKDVDKAYRVDIYNIKNSGLKKTDKYDKKYYKHVVDYYKGLINSYEEDTIYPYYLALAYEKRGEYKKALAILNKVMSSENPYPSFEKLKELKQRLKKKA